MLTSLPSVINRFHIEIQKMTGLGFVAEINCVFLERKHTPDQSSITQSLLIVSKNMLVFHSHCQMANQMFMYACARSLAKHKQLTYCLSSLGNLRYFKLTKKDYCCNGAKYLWFRIAQKLGIKYNYNHCQDNFSDYTATMQNSPHNAWFYGYFQGEQYFWGNNDDIKQRFTIKTSYQKPFLQYWETLPKQKTIVAVHLRRKDYKDFNLAEIAGPNLCLPATYYQKCIAPYRNNPQYHLVFLSDEIAEVQREFADIDNASFSQNQAIIDFQILMHADVLILANSSFSWWGAWLNAKATQVYVPQYFLGFKVKKEYPLGIIPCGWQQIAVQ